MKKITRADLIGHKLDLECHRAKTTTNEYGLDDNRVFCYGLHIGDFTPLDKCRNCKAFVYNAEPPKKENKDE